MSRDGLAKREISSSRCAHLVNYIAVHIHFRRFVCGEKNTKTRETNTARARAKKRRSAEREMDGGRCTGGRARHYSAATGTDSTHDTVQPYRYTRRVCPPLTQVSRVTRVRHTRLAREVASWQGAGSGRDGRYDRSVCVPSPITHPSEHEHDHHTLKRTARSHTL